MLGSPTRLATRHPAIPQSIGLDSPLMPQPENPLNQSTPPNRWALRRRVLLTVLILIVAAASTIYGLAQLNQDPQDDGMAAEPPAEPICRAEGEFVAGFMSPQADNDKTLDILETMNTDAVTFGGRIMPMDATDYPGEVADAIGDRDAYEYTVAMTWDGIELADSDQTVQVGDTSYGIIAAGDNSVVVTESTDGADHFHSLTRTATELDTNAYIGLPVPQMRTSGETWLPDNSYAGVVDAFSQKFVTAYQQRGADGFYLAMEMPLTHEAHWNPVTDYYSRQTQIINDIAPGATVLISPYLEGRADRQTITPETAARGYQKLLGLDNGTHILVSPQDGVGVGTTALAADDSEAHRVTVEDYFAALHAVDPERLYVTIEAMRPGGGSPDSRKPTTRERVEQQLTATEPYVQGAIGFQWAEPNSMLHIDSIGDGACAAGPGQLH